MICSHGVPDASPTRFDLFQKAFDHISDKVVSICMLSVVLY